MLRWDGEDKNVKFLEVFERWEVRTDCPKAFREGVIREILSGYHGSILVTAPRSEREAAIPCCFGCGC